MRHGGAPLPRRAKSVGCHRPGGPRAPLPESRSGRAFAAGIEERSSRWARFGSEIGRERPELGDGMRSVVLWNYIVLVRDGPDRPDALRTVEGHRDLSRLGRS